jgi:hypothetical protein
MSLPDKTLCWVWTKPDRPDLAHIRTVDVMSPDELLEAEDEIDRVRLERMLEGEHA